MKVEEKFNKRDAKFIVCQSPSVNSGAHYSLGIKVELFPVYGSYDERTLSMHMTPGEALEFAERLIVAARHRLAI